MKVEQSGFNWCQYVSVAGGSLTYYLTTTLDVTFSTFEVYLCICLFLSQGYREKETKRNIELSSTGDGYHGYRK